MLTSLAYLGFDNIRDIERMTLREYYLRLEAYQLAKLDRREDIALQAWMNQQVQATTEGKHPKPIFKKFKKFFDRSEWEKDIRHSFGDDYVAKSQRQEKRDDADLFQQRIKEFKKLKSKGQIDMNAWKRARAKEMRQHG